MFDTRNIEGAITVLSIFAAIGVFSLLCGLIVGAYFLIDWLYL